MPARDANWQAENPTGKFLDVKKSTEPVVLECRSNPSITRAEVEEIVRRRALVARELRWLRAEGRRLFEELEVGAEVERGPIPVELKHGWEGCRRYAAVLIDGRPVDGLE